MQIDTPEGKLTIDDTQLKFTPNDDGPELTVPLDPMPDYRYERGIYGLGTLVIGDQTIVLRNEQASVVVEELRRPRTASKPSARKSADAAKSDSDQATAK